MASNKKGSVIMFADAAISLCGMVSCVMVTMAAIGSLVDTMVHRGIIRR